MFVKPGDISSRFCENSLESKKVQKSRENVRRYIMVIIWKSRMKNHDSVIQISLSQFWGFPGNGSGPVNNG